MANENNGVNMTKPEEITEKGLTEVQVPWWKTALKIGGYVLTGVLSGLAGILIGQRMGGDDDDDSPAEEKTEE